MSEIISLSPDETFAAGERFATTLKADDVVVLDGEMGAGKTVFCKGVAKGLGIEEEVLSPTYALMNDYSGKLYHFDCYRLSSGAQAEALGLLDYFTAGGVCLIEWAQNLDGYLPADVKRVKIEKISDGARRIIYG